ncbi:hypothetical protein SP90_05510 [Halodesulfovibrio spirochaetisodalis]|uniref:Uncharacterized protein n=1 Tax=Halodesulfovibrio spirochaetisodalis TaxID=1560234 RepID=A0A1B7XG85_9BACT|nr:hypothetical protein SP90_05510 [Halodesulfovibrio spirochaetisodalis]
MGIITPDVIESAWQKKSTRKERMHRAIAIRHLAAWDVYIAAEPQYTQAQVMDYLDIYRQYALCRLTSGRGWLSCRYTVWAVACGKAGKITAAGPHRIFDRISFAPFGS